MSAIDSKQNIEGKNYERKRKTLDITKQFQSNWNLQGLFFEWS